MKVLFTSTASESHVRPLIPFAQAVRARGHEVRIASLPKIAEFVTSRGFEHMALTGPSDEMRAAFSKRIEGEPMSEIVRIYPSEFFMGLLAESAAPALLRSLDRWRPDLIVRESMELAGRVVAEALGIRHIRHEIVNARSEEAMATDYLDAFNALRSKVSLAPAGPGYLKNDEAISAHPQALDASERLNTMAPVRYLADTVPHAASPAPAGAASEWARRDGVPFIYATFGTVAGGIGATRSIYRATMEACADLPARVLFTTGRDAPPDLFPHVPDNVTVRPFVPQAEVLPHARLLVCHGGSGTVIAGLAHGIPMVIAPMFADQPHNAEALEAGDLCIAVAEPTPETLRAAILQALNDEPMRRRAQEVAGEIAAMPSADELVTELLEG